MIWIRKCVPLLKTVNHISYDIKLTHSFLQGNKCEFILWCNSLLWLIQIAFSDEGSTRTYYFTSTICQVPYLKLQ